MVWKKVEFRASYSIPCSVGGMGHKKNPEISINFHEVRCAVCNVLTYLSQTILGYNPAYNEFSTIFLFQPKVKSILLFYWNLTTYGGWFEKKRAQWSCWTLLAILQKREAPWRQELKRFFCLLTMLTQWGEIISELKRINKVRIQHKDIFQSFYPLITLR